MILDELIAEQILARGLVDPQRMAPLRRSSLHFRYEREHVHWDLLVALALMITTAVYLL